MATTTAHETNNHYDGAAKDYSSSNSGNPTGGGAAFGRQMTHEEHQTATAAARFGYGPLAHINTAESGRLPAFGGEFQPGTYKSVAQRKFANPAPLGLCAFALTTFVLSLINMGTRGVAAPNIVVAIALGYGGLVQLLAGMWYVRSRRYCTFYRASRGPVLCIGSSVANQDRSFREMAVGNTFGATALSSYGGFWIAFAFILTPGGFQIEQSIIASGKGNVAAGTAAFYDSFGFFLMVGYCSYPVVLWRGQIAEYDALTRSGLVHLYNLAFDCHPSLHCCFLLALLHPRYGLPAPRHWLS